MDFHSSLPQSTEFRTLSWEWRSFSKSTQNSDFCPRFWGQNCLWHLVTILGGFPQFLAQSGIPYSELRMKVIFVIYVKFWLMCLFFGRSTDHGSLLQFSMDFRSFFLKVRNSVLYARNGWHFWNLRTILSDWTKIWLTSASSRYFTASTGFPYCESTEFRTLGLK